MVVVSATGILNIVKRNISPLVRLVLSQEERVKEVPSLHVPDKVMTAELGEAVLMLKHASPTAAAAAMADFFKEKTARSRIIGRGPNTVVLVIWTEIKLQEVSKAVVFRYAVIEDLPE